MTKQTDPKEVKAKKDKHANEVTHLQETIAQLTDGLQRERADAMNLRRRFDEEKAGLASFHRANIVRELLPVIDNFERSLKHVPKELEDNEFIKGISSISRQFADILSKLGVSRIETVGTEFDPNLHEAISMEEGDGDRELVSEELQSGYRLGDQVIRHAMVRVKS